MAEGTTLRARRENGAPEKKAGLPGPLSEKAMGPPEPIWVHVKDPEQLRALAREVFLELSREYGCVRGLQTDPHRRFGIVDSFEIYLHDGGREPENIGIVTLYENGKGGPPVLKLNPACAADAETLRKALGAAVGKVVDRFGAAGNVDIKVSEGNSFEFPPTG